MKQTKGGSKEYRWELPPTPRQTLALFRLGVKDENIPGTRALARDLIYRLKKERDAKETIGPK